MTADLFWAAAGVMIVEEMSTHVAFCQPPRNFRLLQIGRAGLFSGRFTKLHDPNLPYHSAPTANLLMVTIISAVDPKLQIFAQEGSALGVMGNSRA